MSIFLPKKAFKTEISLTKHRIDIYNPESEDFNKSAVKENIPNEITTERKQLDIKKDSHSVENYNTSVDMNTNYGEENIDIKSIHNFKNHFSELKFVYNSKADTTISKDLKNSEKNELKKNSIIVMNEIKKEKEKESNNNKEISNGYNIIKQISLQDNGQYNDFDSISSTKEKNILFKEVMFVKDSQFKNDFDFFQRNDTYRTKVIYANKECNLLIIREYLYILELKSKNTKKINNENNPDLSLIYQIEKEEKSQEIEDIIKIQYELSHPLISINFNLLSCKLLLNKKDMNKKNNNEENNLYELQILILGTNAKILFYIKNFEEYKKFSYIIGQKIFISEGYKINKMGLCFRNKDFYKDTYISTAEFESIAKTGDMLLFITMDCISDVQKFFTRDQYDHIALVIILDGDLEILEATSNEKCSLLKWRRFKFNLYNLIFKKIVLRRLNIEEKDPKKVAEIRNNIDEKARSFIQKIHKKEYEMSLLKMAFSRKPEEYEIKGEWEKGSGYCCSALNAAFYVYNGIMKLEKSVHSMRPGDFEQDKNRLTMMPGFSFGPEKIIEFST